MAVIFFDIDGTLLDHDNAQREAAKALCIECSSFHDLTESAFLKLWYDLSERYLSDYLEGQLSFHEQRRIRIKKVTNDNISDEKADQLFSFYLNIYEDSWKLYPDTFDCLIKLSDFHLGIISNGDSSQQRMKLQRTGIDSFFSTIVISDDVGISKPAPQIFIKACKQANAKPQDCYYVGDKLKTDVLPCLDLKIPVIWLNRNFKNNQSDQIISVQNLTDFADIILSPSVKTQ